MPAEAQRRDCSTVRALANADGRRFADLHFGVDPKSGVSVRAERGKPDLANPETCDLDIDRTDSTLSCQWRFPDYAAAIAFFEPLLERMRRCLASPLPAVEIATKSPGWLILRRHQAEFTVGEGETSVELSLIEYTREADDSLPASLDYFVDLTSEWDVD